MIVKLEDGRKYQKIDRISLSELTDATVMRLYPIANTRAVSLKTTIDDDYYVMGDAIKLAQAVYNLTDNAIKYTPDGGGVTVSLTQEEDEIVLRVKDTGVGIPKESLEHIFERFYRVDKARSRATGGTGLGLAIVYDIVSALNGKMEVESVLGEGSTFIVRFPKAVEEEVEEA
jgi:two-component system phosphate regulon sensor histidine kinase PhoR